MTNPTTTEPARMKLWHISQDQCNDYDTYSDAVVAAPDEETARTIHPDGAIWASKKGAPFVSGWSEGEPSRSWCDSPHLVTARLIGDAVPGTEIGVICASFHAG
jgi:hypothetical protein